MYKHKKYYQQKRIRKLLKDNSTENIDNNFYKRFGYIVTYCISKKGKKHPLGQELQQIVSLFKETYIQSLNEYKESDLIIPKKIFYKLSFSQKICFDTYTQINYIEPTYNYRGYLYNNHINPISGIRLLPSLRQYIKPVIKKNYVEIYSYVKTELYYYIKRNALWDIGTKIMGWSAKHRYEDRELYNIKQNKILKNQMKIDLEEHYMYCTCCGEIIEPDEEGSEELCEACSEMFSLEENNIEDLIE